MILPKFNKIASYLAMTFRVLFRYCEVRSSLLLILLFSGCGQNTPTHTDTPTSGVVNISADDSFKPIIDAEIQVFQMLYPNTEIKVHYTSEDSVLHDLNTGSSRLIAISRKLTKNEEDYFKAKTLAPEQVKVAVDALALIVNTDNPDTSISYNKIVAIFTGKDSLWSNPEMGRMSVVFDHENSGNSRYIRDSIIHGKRFPDYCFAVNSNTQVIDFVSKNKNALGIIGVNWVSNDYDSTVVGFLNKVKVVRVSSTSGNYYQPYQAYMQEGYYPLCRDLYFINCEPYTGLASGFLSFVASEKGQRIILREGILPATVPTQVIGF